MTGVRAHYHAHPPKGIIVTSRVTCDRDDIDALLHLRCALDRKLSRIFVRRQHRTRSLDMAPPNLGLHESHDVRLWRLPVVCTHRGHISASRCSVVRAPALQLSPIPSMTGRLCMHRACMCAPVHVYWQPVLAVRCCACRVFLTCRGSRVVARASMYRRRHGECGGPYRRTFRLPLCSARFGCRRRCPWRGRRVDARERPERPNSGFVRDVLRTNPLRCLLTVHPCASFKRSLSRCTQVAWMRSRHRARVRGREVWRRVRTRVQAQPALSWRRQCRGDCARGIQLAC